MIDTVRILLICDDEAGGLELRGLLGSELRVAPILGQGEVRIVPIEVELAIARGAWEMGARDRRYHLGIIAVTGAAPLAELICHPALDPLARVLYLVGSRASAASAVALRPDHDRLVELPCSRTRLLHEVERLLLGALAEGGMAQDDPRRLALVRSLVADGRRKLKPLLLAEGNHGLRYPEVERCLGLGVDPVQVLEQLVAEGLCTRTVAHRLRCCPSCAGHLLSYSDACERCGSAAFTRGTILHHLGCAHLDLEANFRQGDDLVCPKCHLLLDTIGHDYLEMAGCYLCQNCAFIASSTRLQVHCLSCQAQVEPGQTIEQMVFSYELTAQADAAVTAADPAGKDMAGVVRDHDVGRYDKADFLNSLRQELERMRRYDTPVALVVVRSGRLRDLREESIPHYRAHIAALWQAATEGLRTLDIPCVWDEGIVAILLPATPQAGAQVVAQRIAERFRADAPEADRGLELAAAAIQAGHQHEHIHAEALVRDALDLLPADAVNPNDLVVLEEDESAFEPAVEPSWDASLS